MVTRSVILVTASEAAAFAATTSSAATVAAAAAESVINNAPLEQNNTEELHTNNLCNYPSYTKPAQHPSPEGLVQLCRDFEKRGGGLCCIHQKGPMDGEQSDSDDASENDGKIRGVTGDECCLDDEVGQKRALTSGGSISGKNDNKRQRVDAFVIDLTGVPPQSPIPKSAGRIKEGASKYKGVSFNKQRNKWRAQIMIDGKYRHIGYYENEEDAGSDYARAVFKYEGQGVLDKAREQGARDKVRAQRARDKAREQNSFIIDLSDVPPQPPIPKSEGRIKDGASKYTGVCFDKRTNKWKAKITIDGKVRLIGCYEREEAAAVEYARAVFKYKGQGALDKARERRALDKAREQSSFIDIDLRDVPPQSPIPKSSRKIKEGASKYTGVYFNKPKNKWHAQVMIDGKQRHIGYYENEEDAGSDYARAVFKYEGQGALDKAREQRARDTSRVDAFIIDLTDVPPQSPVPKCAGYIKEGASKYRGVSFDKQTNKWHARINIDGKERHIGRYENEEEAAVDYARAVFKYKGQGALDKAREQRARDTSRVDAFTFDLTDVPLQPPVPKCAGYIKEGASKYRGVCFNKQMNKWQAQISIDGKERHIGRYENEEEAAVDYARAVLKYKGQGALDKARERRALDNAREQDSIIIDLSDVPRLPPIP